jgi:antibiotic biosynthesis monooxygenase (ABM) superfamily enzyme
MIVYEVNIDVREDAYADYHAWLEGHVDEMLALPGFVSAEIMQRLEPSATRGTRALTIHYRLTDEAALRAYMTEHAARMREDGLRRFGDAFTATRRVLASGATRNA